MRGLTLLILLLAGALGASAAELALGQGTMAGRVDLTSAIPTYA